MIVFNNDSERKNLRNQYRVQETQRDQSSSEQRIVICVPDILTQCLLSTGPRLRQCSYAIGYTGVTNCIDVSLVSSLRWRRSSRTIIVRRTMRCVLVWGFETTAPNAGWMLTPNEHINVLTTDGCSITIVCVLPLPHVVLLSVLVLHFNIGFSLFIPRLQWPSSVIT